MALRKRKIATIDFDDYVTDYVGVKQDTYLDENNPTTAYGSGNYIRIGDNGGNSYHGVVQIKVPDKGYIVGFSELIKIELVLYFWSGSGGSPYSMKVGVINIQDIWNEQHATWNNSETAINWIAGVGAIKSRIGSIDSAETVVEVTQVTGIGTWASFDLTPVLGLDDDKTFVLFPVGLGGTTVSMDAYSRNYTSNKPILRLTYWDDSPDAFSDKDSALTVEPNPDNPEQPLLKWGGVKDADFVDFKVYRDTSTITSVTALTPIATITSPADQEYIDTGSLSDGTTYYYAVIAEDGNNTGNDATFSNNVSFTKPDVATASMSPSGSQNVGTEVTMAVTSGNNIKKVYVDWKDGVQSWYEFETTGTSKQVKHIYSGTTSGAVTPDVRVQDELGFWSSLTASSNTITVADTTPTAKLRVDVHKAVVGDEVTLDATLSQPVASNVTITNYKFRRYLGDSWHDNGTSPVYSFVTTGFTVGVKTASALITTSSSKTDTDSTTYELETGDPTTLNFSETTKLHELSHSLGQSKLTELPIGSDGVEHEFLVARRAERVTLVGTSNHPNVGTDIDIIRNAWLNNLYVRFTVSTEMESHVVQYDCKIDGDISLGQSFDNKQSWTFPVRVIARTEL